MRARRSWEVRCGFFALSLLVLMGCATTAPVQPAPSALDSEDSFDLLNVPPNGREELVRLAREAVGRTHVIINKHRYSNDCTGLIIGLFDQIGLKLMDQAEMGDNGVTAIYRFAKRFGRLFEGGRPLPGDLVFFRETYDLNRDGRVNDGLTHIGVVDGVAEDGTVSVIHRVARGIVRYKMNLTHPSERVDASGEIINDYLRAAGYGEQKLTGELFAGYATLLPVGRAIAER